MIAPDKLEAALRAAGVPVAQCRSDGSILFSDGATDVDHRRGAEIMSELLTADADKPQPVEPGVPVFTLELAPPPPKPNPAPKPAAKPDEKPQPWRRSRPNNP